MQVIAVMQEWRCCDVGKHASRLLPRTQLGQALSPRRRSGFF
jgi:hypothetical protein